MFWIVVSVDEFCFFLSDGIGDSGMAAIPKIRDTIQIIYTAQYSHINAQK